MLTALFVCGVSLDLEMTRQFFQLFFWAAARKKSQVQTLDALFERAWRYSQPSVVYTCETFSTLSFHVFQVFFSCILVDNILNFYAVQWLLDKQGETHNTTQFVWWAYFYFVQTICFTSFLKFLSNFLQPLRCVLPVFSFFFFAISCYPSLKSYENKL